MKVIINTLFLTLANNTYKQKHVRTRVIDSLLRVCDSEVKKLYGALPKCKKMVIYILSCHAPPGIRIVKMYVNACRLLFLYSSLSY